MASGVMTGVCRRGPNRTQVRAQACQTETVSRTDLLRASRKARRVNSMDSYASASAESQGVRTARSHLIAMRDGVPSCMPTGSSTGADREK